MCKKSLVLALALGLVTGAAQAAQIDLKALGIDADFEDYALIGDGVTNSGWASFPGGKFRHPSRSERNRWGPGRLFGRRRSRALATQRSRGSDR